MIRPCPVCKAELTRRRWESGPRLRGEVRDCPACRYQSSWTQNDDAQQLIGVSIRSTIPPTESHGPMVPGGDA